MNIQIWEKSLNDRVQREVGNFVDTVEIRIQNANLVTVNNIIAPGILVEIRSIYASSKRDVASVMATSKREEQPGVKTSFENESEREDTFREFCLTE